MPEHTKRQDRPRNHTAGHNVDEGRSYPAHNGPFGPTCGHFGVFPPSGRAALSSMLFGSGQARHVAHSQYTSDIRPELTHTGYSAVSRRPTAYLPDTRCWCPSKPPSFNSIHAWQLREDLTYVPMWAMMTAARLIDPIANFVLRMPAPASPSTSNRSSAPTTPRIVLSTCDATTRKHPVPR